MREVTVIYKVYKYGELSSDAKAAVRKWYLDGQEASMFSLLCKEQIDLLFPESSLLCQYSLNYCQGDGFNIYGSLCLDEALENVKDKFTGEELEWLRPVVKGRDYEILANSHYNYCICSTNDFTGDIKEELEEELEHSTIQYDLLDKFNKNTGEFLDNLCAGFEKQGYQYFYEIEEDELEEWCETNEYEFYESGELFCK